MVRNVSLDLVRFFCAFLVVCVHIGSPFYPYYSVLTTIAVPTFFMLSGYLLSMGDMNKHVNKAIPKIFQLLMWSTLFFAIVKSVQSWWYNDWSWIAWKRITDFIFFNENPFGAHLWYLSAYLYVLIILKFIIIYKRYRRRVMRLLMVISPWIMAIDILLSNKYLNIGVPMLYTRNWYLQALPCTMIGMWVGYCKKGIFLTLSLLILGCIVLALEGYYRCVLLQKDGYGIYFGSILFSAGIIQFASTHPLKQNNYLTEIGRKYSLGIYIMHLFVGIAFGMCGLFRHVELLYYYAPIIVFAVTIWLLKSMVWFQQTSIYQKHNRALKWFVLPVS